MAPGQVSEAVSFGPPGAKRQRPPVPSWVKVLALLVLIPVLVTVGFRAHDWWTHPTVFGGGYDNGVNSFATGPGITWSFALSQPHGGHAKTVTFRGTPEHSWRVNTAAATLTVEICHINDAGFFPGQGVGDGPPNCLSLKPVRNGTTFRYPSPHEYLLAEVQGADPGRATLDTITYDYRAGTDPWSQRGLDTQHFHLTFSVSNSPTGP